VNAAFGVVRLAPHRLPLAGVLTIATAAQAHYLAHIGAKKPHVKSGMAAHGGQM
jgi:hypothetical protein